MMQKRKPFLRMALWAFYAFALAAPIAARGQGSDPGNPERARELMRFLEEGRFVSAVALFDDNFKTIMPAEKLAEYWKAQAARFGAYQGSSAGERRETVSGFDAVTIQAKFAKAIMDIRVFFGPEGKVASLAISPASDGAASFEAPKYAESAEYEELDYAVVTGEFKLPATLTLPRGDGPFPAVVMVSGRGANDRDCTTGANKPFRDLALGLAARGIASLRYDKRTFAYGSKLDIKYFTCEEDIAEDAVSAIKRLRKERRVDKARIFLLGHGLAGQLVPEISSRARSNLLGDNIVAGSIPFASGSIYLAGGIILAGSARPVPNVVADQLNAVAEQDGKVSPEEMFSIRDVLAKLDAMAETRDASAAPVMGITWPYMKSIRDLDAVKTAQKLDLPLFIAQGGRDFEVSPERDYGAWTRELSGRPDVSFHIYPSLNHLFISGNGKSSPGEYDLPGHVAPELIEDLAVWILRTAKTQK